MNRALVMPDETNQPEGEPNVVRDTITVESHRLVDKVRSIINEGNARRIIIRKEGRTVMEFPLSVGVGGATAAVLLSPTLAAIGAFAALVSEVEVVIERPAEPGDESSPAEAHSSNE